MHDETGPNCGLGLLKVDFPAVETGGCGDEHACPAERESHVRMEVYLLEQVRTRQILLRLNGRWPGYGGARTRFRASSQAFLRSVAFALLTLIVSRCSADTGMLRGPGGFSGEAELPRRELESGAAGSGVSSFADFLCGMPR